MDNFSDIQERLSHLTAEKQEKLRNLIKQRLAVVDTSPSVANPSLQRLTNAQQRLWVLEKFERVKYLYHVPLILELPRNIDQNRLKKSIEILSKEHSQLVSYFIEEPGEVMQAYANHFTMPVKDILLLEKLPEDLLAIQANHPLADFFLQPFELDKPPLIRFALAQENSSLYLLICCHHLIMDAWSADLLIHYLCEIYCRESLTLALDTKPRPYSEYAKWEIEQLINENYAEVLAYWVQERENRVWKVDLPTDFSSPPHLSGKGKQITATISKQSLAKLRIFASQQQLSVNHVILSLFQLLLARYSGQDDIVVGIPVAGRQNRHWQKTIGLFVNTFVHSIKVDYTLTFKQQVANTKTQLLKDLANSALPYDDLLKCLYQRQLCPQGTSFNVLYNFLQNENMDSFQFMGQGAKILPCLLPLSKFDLSCHVLLTTDELTLIFEYSTDLFHEETIKQIQRDFIVYLETFIDNPTETMRKVFWSLN